MAKLPHIKWSEDAEMEFEGELREFKRENRILRATLALIAELAKEGLQIQTFFSTRRYLTKIVSIVEETLKQENK